MQPDPKLEKLAASIGERDWALSEGFLSAAQLSELSAEALGLRVAGHFRPAGIGHVAELRNEVRGDELLWLTPETCPRAWQLKQTGFEALRYTVNAGTLLGLHELEAHYTAYPPGAGYLRHLDRFRDDDRRVISLVLYLNEGWGAEDGGELILYPGDSEQPVKVIPTGGNLVCFLSDRVPHEVLPARRLRLSLTGWFRKRG